MSDSVRRLLQGSLGRAFAAWSRRVHEKAALKHKAVQCLARLTHAHAASAFTAWLDWAAAQKEHRSASLPDQPSNNHSLAPGFIKHTALHLGVWYS